MTVTRRDILEIDKHRYSVLQALVGLKLDARITAGAVELLHRGRRVASHARNDRVGGYTTVVEHMPAAHRPHLEWTPQRQGKKRVAMRTDSRLGTSQGSPMLSVVQSEARLHV